MTQFTRAVHLSLSLGATLAIVASEPQPTRAAELYVGGATVSITPEKARRTRGTDADAYCGERR